MIRFTALISRMALRQSTQLGFFLWEILRASRVQRPTCNQTWTHHGFISCARIFANKQFITTTDHVCRDLARLGSSIKPHIDHEPPSFSIFWNEELNANEQQGTSFIWKHESNISIHLHTYTRRTLAKRGAQVSRAEPSWAVPIRSKSSLYSAFFFSLVSASLRERYVVYARLLDSEC